MKTPGATYLLPLLLSLLAGLSGCTETREGIIVHTSGPHDTPGILQLTDASAKKFHLHPTGREKEQRIEVLQVYSDYDGKRMLVEQLHPDIVYVQTNPYFEGHHEGLMHVELLHDMEGRLLAIYPTRKLHVTYGLHPAKWAFPGP